MSNQQPHIICVIGDKGVGKDTFIKSVLGDSEISVITFKTNLIPMHFNIVNNAYADKISGAIVMFDLTSRSTFKYATKLIADLPDIPIVLVGNKTDVDTSKISSREIREFVENAPKSNKPKKESASVSPESVSPESVEEPKDMPEEKESTAELLESVEEKLKAVPKIRAKKSIKSTVKLLENVGEEPKDVSEEKESTSETLDNVEEEPKDVSEEKESTSETLDNVEEKPKAVPKIRAKKPIKTTCDLSQSVKESKAVSEEPTSETSESKIRDNLKYFEISCKTDDNCDELFLCIARELTGNKRLEFQ